MVPGVDMTAEAALTKLSYLLSRDMSTDDIREMMQHNIRGELTTLGSHQQQFSLKDSELLRMVARALNVSSNKVSEPCVYIISYYITTYLAIGGEAFAGNTVSPTNVCCSLCR